MKLSAILLALALALPPVPPAPPPTPWPTIPPPSPPAPPDDPVAPYFPIHRTWVWHYRSPTTGEVYQRRFAGRENANDRVCHRFVRPRPDGTQDVELYSNDALGLSLHASRTAALALDLAPPVTFAERDLLGTPDEHVVYPAVPSPVTHRPMRWRTHLLGHQDIHVAAGTFPECLHVHLDVQERSGEVMAAEELWLARGTGIVLRAGKFFGVNVMEELVRLERR